MEVARLLIGLTVAIFLADSLPVLRRFFIFRAILAWIYAAWVMVPILALWKTLSLAFVVAFWSCALGIWEKLAEERVTSSGGGGGKRNERKFGLRFYLSGIGGRLRSELVEGKTWITSNRMAHGRSIVSAVLLICFTAFLLGLAIGPQRLSNILVEAVANNSFAIVTSGALASVFVSHEVVARIYSLFD
ncbi:hypothetical protein E1287_33600, partial [Actinomadura sp. KC06]|uniref:hypothetical protein n=1 Tax=Actinomadura sp. KC06 TaxID=2530369 RepID=UPI0010440CB7